MKLYSVFQQRKGDVEKAIESIRSCIAWRSENKDWIERAKAGEKAPKHAEISKVCVLSFSFTSVDNLAEMLLLYRTNISNTRIALYWWPLQEHGSRRAPLHRACRYFRPKAADEEIHTRRCPFLAQLEQGSWFSAL